MKKLLLVTALVILCVSGAAFAQDTVPVFCGGLAQADCDILTRSQEAAKTLDSASFDFSADVTVSNIPDMTAPVTVSVTGSGSFSGATSIQGDMAAMQTDPSQAALSVLDNLDLDFSLTVTVPRELLGDAPKGTPNSLTLQLRLVDGVGYLNLDTLQALLGEMGDSGMSGWNGIDLAGLVRALMEQMPDLFNGMTMGGIDSSAMQSYMEQFSDPEFLSQFMTIERTDDGSGDTATFAITLNFAALMSNPDFMDMMRQQIEAQMQAQDQKITEKEMQQALDMSMQMMQGMTMNMTEEIGVEDGFIHGVNGAIAFDMSSMMAALGESGSASAGAAPGISVEFSFTASQFNSVPAITAPEDATVIPYESLLGMMGNMSGMMEQSG